MLKITVPGSEWFDETSREFITHEPVELELEHSLVTLSKWEAIWEKPFLSAKDKTSEDVLTYIATMIQTANPPKDIMSRFTQENLDEVSAYIDAKMTGTWFNEHSTSRGANEIITAELIYYWMSEFNINIECENWHLNRLFTLLKVHNAKKAAPKKMSPAEIHRQNREENARRRAAYKSKG